MLTDHRWILMLAVAMTIAAGCFLLHQYRARRETTRVGGGLEVLFESRHLAVVGLDSFPEHALSIPADSTSIHRFRQLAADAGKAAVFLPGRTLQVVFKPEIQEGLKSGAYTLMRTDDGETLADAVNKTTGRVVGKGRLIESGKIRQLAAVGFQMVSIAVAQAHLAEIAEGMRAINSKLDSITNRLEANDLAEIEGSIAYVLEIAAFIKRHENRQPLSAEMAQNLEATIRCSHIWQRKVLRHLGDLLIEAASLTDLDTFGTGTTFDALNQVISQAKILAQRQDFYGEFTSTVNCLTAFIDPTRTRFTQANVTFQEWDQLSDQLAAVVTEKVSLYFRGDVRFNRESTLSSRRKALLSEVDKLTTQRLGMKKKLASRAIRVEQALVALPAPGKPVRMALTIDARGDVTCAGVLPTVD